MHTTGIITDSAYRSLVEFRVERKKKAISTQTMTAAKRLGYFILLTPAIFFLVAYFVFHLGLVAAVVISLLWLVSFSIAGFLFHRGTVSAATKRPAASDIGVMRDYVIKDGWLVERTTDTEKRIALRRAVELIVTPTVSYLDCGELGLVLLPFGSASTSEGQREFLESLKSQLP